MPETSFMKGTSVNIKNNVSHHTSRLVRAKYNHGVETNLVSRVLRPLNKDVLKMRLPLHMCTIRARFH